MKKKAKIIILTTVTILWMAFIFSMSAKNATQSSNISGGFTYNVLNTFFGQFRSIDKTTQNGIVERIILHYSTNNSTIKIEDSCDNYELLMNTLKSYNKLD